MGEAAGVGHKSLPPHSAMLLHIHSPLTPVSMWWPGRSWGPAPPPPRRAGTRKSERLQADKEAAAKVAVEAVTAEPEPRPPAPRLDPLRGPAPLPEPHHPQRRRMDELLAAIDREPDNTELLKELNELSKHLCVRTRPCRSGRH